MVSNAMMKAWFIKLVIGSSLIIMFLWLCTVDMAGKKHPDSVGQGENRKHRQAIKERLSHLPHSNAGANSLEKNPHQNHFLASLREWLPNLGFSDQLQEHYKNKEQQPPQQKHHNKTSREEFQKRRRRVNYVCSHSQVIGDVKRFMTDKQAGVVYCIVPKAGCTFWKRIFTALYLKSNGTEEAISSLTREAVHDPYNAGLMNNYAEINTTKYPTRFFVTRDPYSRLLSSYIDKIYLPDFWEAEAVKIAKNMLRNSSLNGNEDFLRKHFNEMAKIFQEKLNVSKITTNANSTCGKYMTFSEFVEAGLDRAEPHWMPIHTVCNPCQFKVTHISTIETFAADARFILSRMKLEHVVENSDHKTQVDEEINMISQYNFNIYNKIKAEAFYKSCVGPREIAYRLWHNFQWRGYIDPDISYKIPDVKDLQVVKADFMVQVKVARESGLQNPKKMKAAQKEFKRKAYLSISKTTFERITQKYALDFELFGYTDVRDEMYTYYSTEGR